MKKRRYTLKQRAQRQRETRNRIVDAAMKLHELRGPADTSISALADAAGVQRLTVYRHFASERELFAACTSTWLGQNPPPQITEISARDTADRSFAILLALFRYYQQNQKMWAVAYRDRPKLPALDEAMTGFDRYLASVQKELLTPWVPSRSRQLRAAVGHAVQFSTWRSLTDQRLGAAAMARLVNSWIAASAGVE